MSPDPDRSQQPLVTPYRAAIHWAPLVVAIALIGAGIGAGIGLQRTPQYEAQATLTIGKSAAAAQSVPGYVAAVESLAGSYSRVATSQKIAALTSRELRIPVADITRSVEATQVPESSIIVIRAKGTDSGEVVRIANATSRSLNTYTSVTETSAAVILKSYENAQRSLARSTAKVGDLRRRNRKGDVLVRAQAKQAADRLRSTSLATAYPLAQSNTGRLAVDVLTPATEAVSDRRTTLRLYVIVGLVLSLVLGVTLATLLANRRPRE